MVLCPRDTADAVRTSGKPEGRPPPKRPGGRRESDVHAVRATWRDPGSAAPAGHGAEPATTVTALRDLVGGSRQAICPRECSSEVLSTP